jgi:adenylate kinase family enzyme
MKGFTITNADETLCVSALFTVLFGAPGVGKTSLAFTAPAGVLHLDFDKGAQRAIQKVRPATVRVESWSDFWGFVKSNDFTDYVTDNGIKTVVIDTIGTMLDNCIAPALIASDMKLGSKNGGLTLQGYGSLKQTFAAFKNRLQSLGLTIVAVCHSKEVGDENTKRFEFAVTGGSSDILFQTADLIGYVSIVNNARVIDFDPKHNKVGKNIGGIAPSIIPLAENPEYDTFLADIHASAITGMMAQSESQKEHSLRMADWKAKVEGLSDLVEFEQCSAELAELPVGLLKASCKQLFAKQMGVQKVTFNKTTKSYEKKD